MPSKRTHSNPSHALREALEQGKTAGDIEEVSAEAIRELLTDPDLAKRADPRGVRLRGPTRVIGELSLDGVETKIGLTLIACSFNGAVTLRDTSATWVRLERCVLPRFASDRAKLDTLEVEDCTLEGECADGILRLTAAHVAKELRLSGTRIANSRGSALAAAGVTVDGSAFLDGICARGTHASEGAVCLSRATIGGDLVMRCSRIRSHGGPALLAEGLTVKGDAFKCEARGQGLVCERRDEGTVASASTSKDAVRLVGATILEQLALSNATLINDMGPALSVDFMTVGQGMFLDEGFVACGASERGVVCMPSAKINGLLSLRGAKIQNRLAGPALLASGVSVQGDLHMDKGPAHDQDDGAFRMRGGGAQGTVHVADASISKRLCFEGEVESMTANGPSLNLARTSVTTLKLDWDSIMKCPVVVLDGLTYSGRPTIDPPHPSPQPDPSPRCPRWRALFSRSGGSRDVQRWISCLRMRMPDYAAQPYEQLATAYTAAGYDADARHIYVAQRDDLRARGKLSPLSKLGQFFLKWLIGYGYYCIRAFLWLLALYAVTAACALAANGLVVKAPATAESAASTSSATVKPPQGAEPATPAAPEPCPATARLGYALELAFPVINLNSAAGGQQCTAAAGAEGWVIGGWFIRAAAAVLAAVYLAGLGGITRSS